jgi:hypothetical protein
VFLNYFDVQILKINFLKIKNMLLNEKYSKKKNCFEKINRLATCLFLCQTFQNAQKQRHVTSNPGI